MDKRVNPHNKIYYIIGASGSGKDTLINNVRDRLPLDVIIAKRYITRAYDPIGEDHTPLSDDAFDCLHANNQFAMVWQSHGVKYGIGREINEWLSCGMSVIVNGSRCWLPKALETFPSLMPVVIDVSEDVLRERLIARGRETDAEIEKRLQRARDYRLEVNEFMTVNNDGSPEQAANAFLKLVGDRCLV